MFQTHKYIQNCWVILRILPMCLFLLYFSTQIAHAQSPVCRRINEQLTALDRDNGDPNQAAQISRQAEAQSNEANRIASQMRRMGCDGDSVLMGAEMPGECGVLAERMRTHRQNAVDLRTRSTYALSASNETRRNALMSSYSNYGCERAGRDDYSAGDSRSSVTIMPPRPRASDDFMLPKYDDTDPDGYKQVEPQPRPRGFGASQPMCVRLCDGYFFPLSGISTRADAQDMCQAQCPASKSQVFYRTNSSDINEAADDDGRTYSSLPNALKYRTRTDQTCTCKRTGETWGSTLKSAEQKVVGGEGDLIVNDKIADDIVKSKAQTTKQAPKQTSRKNKQLDDDVLSNAPLRAGR
jgi:Protein of unknown function (DUF2865)